MDDPCRRIAGRAEKARGTRHDCPFGTRTMDDKKEGRPCGGSACRCAGDVVSWPARFLMDGEIKHGESTRDDSCTQPAGKHVQTELIALY